MVWNETEEALLKRAGEISNELMGEFEKQVIEAARERGSSRDAVLTAYMFRGFGMILAQIENLSCAIRQLRESGGRE